MVIEPTIFGRIAESLVIQPIACFVIVKLHESICLGAVVILFHHATIVESYPLFQIRESSQSFF